MKTTHHQTRQMAVLLTALAGLATLGDARAANLILNPGFENATGTDLADWNELGAAPPNATVGYSTISAYMGSGHALMTIDNTGTAIGAAAFVEQVTAFGSVDPMLTYDLSFAAKLASTDLTGINVFAQVIFLDMDGSHGGGVKGETLQSLVATITTDYQTFTFTGLTPETGADGALVRFQLAAGAVPGINNGFFVDDASLEAVPEPAGVLLAGLGSMMLLKRRRKA